MPKIEKNTYKGIESFELSEGSLEVTVLPLGGKIQCIRFNGKEHLWQTQGEHYKASDYDTLFENGEFSGFDDMFPTISACFYPDGPWKGTPLPDHGEVWSLPWDCAVEDEGLNLHVHGVRLPYLFEKRITITDGELLINYCATNLSPFPMKVIWAAHPLFRLDKGMRLELPAAQEIINVYGGCKYLGDYGEHHIWPVSKDGRDMSRLDPSLKCCNKYYVWNPMERNTARLVYPSGETVTMSAPIDSVPYLGVWVNEDGYGDWGQKNVAPEPCTGAFDALDTASKFGKAGLIEPKSQKRWHLTISITRRK